MMNKEPTGCVTTLSSIVRFTKAMNNVSRARAHTVIVTRKAMRPSLRSPGNNLGAAGNKESEEDQHEGAFGPHRSAGAGRIADGISQGGTGLTRGSCAWSSTAAFLAGAPGRGIRRGKDLFYFVAQVFALLSGDVVQLLGEGEEIRAELRCKFVSA